MDSSTNSSPFVNLACGVLIVGLLAYLVWVLVRMEQQRRHPERCKRSQMTNTAFASVMMMGLTVMLFGTFGDVIYLFLAKGGAPSPIPVIGAGLDALARLGTCALVLRWGFYGVYVDEVGIRSVPEFGFARITRTAWSEVACFEARDDQKRRGYMAFMVLSNGTSVCLSGITAMQVGAATGRKVKRRLAAL